VFGFNLDIQHDVVGEGESMMVAPPAIRVASKLEASSGESVRVSGGNVVGVRVTVTVTASAVGLNVAVDVAIGVDVTSQLSSSFSSSAPTVEFPFVFPKMPPVALVASIAEIAFC